MKSINPYNLSVIREYEPMSWAQVDDLLHKGANAWETWKFSSWTLRSHHMKKAAAILRERKHALADLMMEEMGKRRKDGIGEIEKCAWVCDYYAENAESFLRKEEIESDASQSFVAFRPLGVVLAVMPWNFPFWQVFRFLAPALMAGNAAVLKHASNVTGCALAIQDIISSAGFPRNLFSTLIVPSSDVADIIEHPVIKAVTLTGSTPAGRSVAESAGRAIKKSVLELGGSDPYVILKDAPLEETVESCVTSRLINAGQSCIAAKRFIVHADIYDEFLDRMKSKMSEVSMGDPADDHTGIGPMARIDLRDELHKQVKDSIKAGAVCIQGGDIPDLPGAFYPPTILADVIPGMPAFDEELFGPVAAVIRAESEEEAFDLANQTIFGLGAAVFTSDINHGREIAEKYLDAGCCFVNDFVKSDPRLPFGGIKTSGYGRELSSFGIREFVNIKTVYVK
ncbi:NAD-dependent succinate-semialdehyde dehydrogenase [Fulvivirga sedimenti]|uniref:NAD-dependent succinate-semialdehyde dehydrogenase n=1 Tax=Fulvivirga sedimenti TaxID=2879465 RepID=A0A9X1HSI9_9BACT|nr:NAD-dependent succinate-semialdehyde dehydrogenase [Fulvivirga sedimenti]MCA6074861.1 NAD-dependent succinate-semialdehyde dehydrogenase [Fulvivirga sedimenti]MCA6076038.1 NAD-dependent succinate-semialdehyde dehydrogenase [Fulvivirga sedimenti]MCA6077166.1 NAD-dependent succinate-semialdehyde dehydrogenase [Fulvivirga sedimenti]